MWGLTKKVDYSLLLLTALAERPGKIVSLKEIAQKKGIPSSFLSRVAVLLKNAGVISSKEGRGGGYFIDKDPREISVIEVINLLEGHFHLISCNSMVPCPAKDSCSIRTSLSMLENAVLSVLGSYTVADLISP